MSSKKKHKSKKDSSEKISKKKSKKKSKKESKNDIKTGGVLADRSVFDQLVSTGVFSSTQAAQIMAAEAQPGRANQIWTPLPHHLDELRAKQSAAAAIVANNRSNNSNNSNNSEKYLIPFPTLFNPYGYSSSYFNSSIPRPTYTKPPDNIVMPQYKDRNIETQIHNYRERLISNNTWNNLHYEKMMSYGLSRIPRTINEETKAHIKNYTTALILYGMNKIISDYELRNLIENGVRDAVAYGEKVKEGDNPVVIYKPYTDSTSAHPASVTPEVTEKERRKKKKSKKKKKLQKIKEMELLSEIKELLKQKTSN